MFRGYSLRHLQLIFERLLDLKLYAGGVVGTFCHDKTISLVEIGFTGVKLKRHVSPVVVHGRMFKGRKINTGLYILYTFLMLSLEEIKVYESIFL